MQRKNPISTPLTNLRKTFTRWLGSDYDLDAIHAALAAAEAEYKRCAETTLN